MDNRTPDLILYIPIEIGDGRRTKTVWGQIGALYANPEGEGFTGHLELLPGQRSKITTKPPEA